MTSIFDTFGAHPAMVAAVAAKMRDLGLTPDDVLRQYDAYMQERMRDMVSPPEPSAPDPDVRRPEGQADAEHRLGACPKCGAEVWGIKKCPHISPPWRTFFACDAPDCPYHGRSRLTVEVLRRQWPAGAEEED